MTDTSHWRPPRSFQPRRRGLSPSRDARYRALLERWSLDADGPVLDPRMLFGQSEVVLDVGFGGGEGLIEMALSHPQQAIIGVEVHTPGVAAVLEAIDDHDWQHVRVVQHDALDFIDRIPLGSLAGFRLWFPDPWPKQRQRHRRFFRPDVVTRVVDRVAVGGFVHVATDIADYAQQVREVARADGRLDGGEVPRPDWRPLTRYEQRGLAAGRLPTDLIFCRVC